MFRKTSCHHYQGKRPKYGDGDDIPQNLGRSAYLPRYTASNREEDNLATVTTQD